MADFSFEVIENCGSLSESGKGWKKEIKLISWNGKDPKYDIRDWSPDGSKMSKGISMTRDELAALKGILDEMEL